MKMNKTSVSKSVSDNLISLYTRIPDYSEVQHLGQSDFINTLETLKEEFRQCRASLYNEEFCSDSEKAEKSSPVNSRSRTADNLYYYSSSKFVNNDRENNTTSVTAGGRGGIALTFGDDGKITKVNNNNLTSNVRCNESGNASRNASERFEDRDTDGRQYLSIKSCELHRTPYRSTSASSLTRPSRYLTVNHGRSPFAGSGGNLHGSSKTDSAFQDDDYEDYNDHDDDDIHEYNLNNKLRKSNGRAWSEANSSNSDISISKWSSSPEIYRSRSKEHLPPSNVQKRLLQRRRQNHSAPSVAFKEDQAEDVPKQTFKANPVPDHVYKPLYEFIMLKNQRRSERIREQSKRRLLSQVKPFSFCKDSRKTASMHKGDRSAENLNNTKPLKKRRNDNLGNIKTNNNRLNSTSSAFFRAKPAPPRTKALLAAIKQKEQQEYRELKKRLRSETLLKNASLPPSMAAREKRSRLTNAKIDQVLIDYQKSFPEKKNKSRNYRETSAGTDDTGVLTDDDRMTEDDFLSGCGASSIKKSTTTFKPSKLRKFTSFGASRHCAAAAGVFEASSNDNHASRLRYQAAKLKEEVRIQREEEELLRVMKAEKRRQRLRDCHLFAWQHASSYSAEQDIAMRRQLRHAASILERETFVRDMSSMLSRVRSAPLLLEGGHRLERKQEPCKKHRDEFKNESGRQWNKLSTPRLYGLSGGDLASNKQHHRHHTLDRYGGGADEKSETAALAEGSLSNSDNESDDRHDDIGGHHPNKKSFDLLVTDSGSSDLEEDDCNDGNRNCVRERKQNRVKMTIKTEDNDQAENYQADDENREARDDDALSTDNEIVDDADDDDEEGEKPEEDDSVNNGESGNGEIIEMI